MSRTRTLAAIVLALFAILAAGCASTSGRAGRGAPDLTGNERIQVGVASYYGREHDGRRTASGERFDMKGMTAAHRTLPFGTRVRVTNLLNGRWVVVRINDRGPFKRGRIIDVSHRAGQELGLVGPGTAKVRVVVLGALAGSE